MPTWYWTLVVAFLVGTWGGVMLIISEVRHTRHLRRIDQGRQYCLDKAIKYQAMAFAVLAASRAVIQELEEVGERQDWSDGAETHRVYYWYEVEPLAKAIQEADALLQRDTPVSSVEVTWSNGHKEQL